MEDKIWNLLVDYGMNERVADQCTKELLLLCGVVGRSEQLKAFIRWVKANDRYIVDGDFNLIDDYFKSL